MRASNGSPFFLPISASTLPNSFSNKKSKKMLRNYLLVALRNLAGHKLFSVINVLGLTIGLACVMLIALFVRSEVGYDTQWPNADRTYRVMRNFELPGSGAPLYLATNAPPVGPLL